MIWYIIVDLPFLSCFEKHEFQQTTMEVNHGYTILRIEDNGVVSNWEKILQNVESRVK